MGGEKKKDSNACSLSSAFCGIITKRADFIDVSGANFHPGTKQPFDEREKRGD